SESAVRRRRGRGGDRTVMLGDRMRRLPASRTSLVGREDELALTSDLLLGGEGRLLTLTGVGGCGKTRLALQLAASVGHAFPDGVWLVELAAVGEAALVPEAVAAALDLRAARGQTPLDALATFLAPRTALLVLDNCEHVVGAGAQLAERLLAACPGPRTLAPRPRPTQISRHVQ